MRGIDQTIFLIILAAAVLPPVAAGKQVTLRLDSYLELEDSGLRFRPFRGFELQPLPPLDTHIMQHSRSGERQDAHRPRDFFVYQQREAILRSDLGTIEIASLRFPALHGVSLLNNTHATAAELLAARKPAPRDWLDLDLDAWVSAYTGLAIAKRSTRIKDFHLLLPYIAYTFDEEEAPRTVAFIMRLTHAAGATRHVLFLIRFEEGQTISNADEAIAGMLASLRTTRPDDISRAPNHMYQIYPSQQRHGDQDRTRQEVIRNLRNLDTWWYVETPNYILASDLGPRERGLVLTIQEDVEQLRKIFTILLPPIVEIQEVSIVRVFANRDDYLRFVPDTMQWTAGAWLPARNELILGPPREKKRAEDQAQLLQMLYHEALHQYLYYAMDHRPFPVWYDEGHAAFVEGIVLDTPAGSWTIEEAPRYGELLVDLIEKQEDNIGALLSMDDKAFYAMDRRKSYPLAWGLIYFLRKAAPLIEDRRYHGFCERVRQEVDQRQATSTQILDSLTKAYDLTMLQQDFRAFWANPEARQKARHVSLTTQEAP